MVDTNRVTLDERGLDRAALDRARLSRDPRFDGKFFIAITSTGIYCRPICPSPTAKRENVLYFATAAAAAEAGFRPCLRCRPEAAPGTPAWLGTSALVRRALRLIHEGVLDETSVDALATRLGIGSRHLHRLFMQYIGASPITVAQTRRLQFAKQLLDDTSLNMTDIALAAGFGSLRRFNDAFRKMYGRAPRDLRRRPRVGLAADDGGEVTLQFAFRPPYDWPHTRDFLAAHAVPGVERADASGYARAVALEVGHAVVDVRPVADRDVLELRVRGAPPAALHQLTSAARRVFDLASDPAYIARALRADPLLAPLVERWPGLRIPGAWDPFECAVLALLGQPVDPAEARMRAGRLVARLGRSIGASAPSPGDSNGLTRLFPSPAELAASDLDGLGLPPSVSEAIRVFARAVTDGPLDLGGPADVVVAGLAALPGFGENNAQYVALRGLGEPDAFPVDFVAAEPIGLEAPPSRGSPPRQAIGQRAETWRPWRGYASLYLRRAEPALGRESAPQP